ncbi:MAG: type VI secretion system tip protein VgrG [Polyangiaceae bacterium]|jgi:type VI secretion system secreted protein VgrG|nr:type VI secretion system tip protein VgrG [Polyangiaceae bacterium]
MSQNLELTFASKEDSLSVRRFAVSESLSGLFTIDVIARSEVEELDLESIVGHGATFRVLGDAKFFTDTKLRVWTGVCSHMEQLQGEETGLSTYLIRIVPGLWRTTLRTNCRIFQRQTLPDIVKAVLLEWEIEPELRLTESYVKHEYRVQYLETDFAFISRLLEEAGITYFFEFDGGDGSAPAKTKLVLSDAPHKGPLRPGDAIPYVDNHTHEGRREFITKVRFSTAVRPGHWTTRDFDFRLRPDYQLLQEHKEGVDRELKLERYEYLPGSFWVETQGARLPFADDKGLYKADEPHGKLRSRLSLEAERTGRRGLSFETNVIDLAPGKVFMMSDHARKDLVDKRLLVSRMELTGSHAGDYAFSAEAFFADDVVRPPRVTPRPRIYGVQSAVVVGPPGEEIHTDELGRVRVQFHWDREHSYSDESSCWIRVVQGWAGLGYGMVALPRVGQEVLVEFFDGDPDRPVVTGRVFNATSQVPYKLPDNKTKSGWKTDSSPGSNGFNELMFEDKKGSELIHVQAEKNFTEVVKNDQSSTVLNSRSASVSAADSTTVGGTRSVNVGESQVHVVKRAMLNDAGEFHSIHVASGTGTEISDKRIVSTTGGASITLAGDNIILEAKASIFIIADQVVKVHSKGQVEIDGGNTYINCFSPSGADPKPFDKAQDPSAPGSGGEAEDKAYKPSGQGSVEVPGGFDEADPNVFIARPPTSPGAAPSNVAIDAPAAAEIAREVLSQTPAASMDEGTILGLKKEYLDKGIQVVKALQDFEETRGQSLLSIPELKDAIGAAVSTPIVGDVSGKDIADLMNMGSKLGIWHLSPDAQAAVDFVTKAAPEAPAAPAQVMGVKTQEAPSQIDGEALDGAMRAARAAGASTIQAQAAALAKQGVATYLGDLAGGFVKIPG